MPKHIKELKFQLKQIAEELGYVILGMEQTNHLMVHLAKKTNLNFQIKPKGFSTTPTTPLKKDQIIRQIRKAEERKKAWDNWRKDPTIWDKPQA